MKVRNIHSRYKENLRNKRESAYEKVKEHVRKGTCITEQDPVTGRRRMRER